MTSAYGGGEGARARTVVRAMVWLIAAVFAWRIFRISWGHWQTGAASDFYYFWDAAANVLGGHAQRVYEAHSSAVGPLRALAYPPPFLMIVAPLATMPVSISLLLWLGLTGAAYVIASRQNVSIALANPAAPYNVRWGQTGFLTAGIFLGGLNLLARRPVLAGVVLGLMVIKPHLALLIPLALAAGRVWKALAGAATSAAALVALAGMAFGPAIYAAWFNAALHFNQSLANGLLAWSEYSSVYSLLRYCGAVHAIALAGQLLAAGVAIVVVLRSWRRNERSKIAILAAGTMLVPSYLCAYDATVMVAPLGLLVDRSPVRAAIVWILLCIPWLDLITPGHLPIDVSNLPDTTPIAAALSLLFLSKDWVWEDDPTSTELKP